MQMKMHKITPVKMEWNGMEWNGMEWGLDRSNKTQASVHVRTIIFLSHSVRSAFGIVMHRQIE